MPKALRIHKKLTDKHVVWFGESNQWVGFETPAYKVYKWYEKGLPEKKIKKKLIKKYGLEAKEAEPFISEIILRLEKITSAGNSENSPPEKQDQENRYPAQSNGEALKNIDYSYLINNQVLSVEYTHEKLAYYLHAPIKHLQTDKKTPGKHKLRLTVNNPGFGIFRNGNEIQSCDSISELKHAFTGALMYTAYGVEMKEWFAWIHGSAVSNGEKAIIFSSGSGSGKSTMATILQSQGYLALSDDMIYMRSGDKLAYPVPGALSMKEGAIRPIQKYLPGLNPDEMEVYEYGDRRIRFLAPAPGEESRNTFKPIPIASIVFLSYNPEISFKFKKLSDYEAFSRFHKEAWINGSEESARIFINWFEKLSYYVLNYSDTDKAIKQIEKLFQENS